MGGDLETRGRIDGEVTAIAGNLNVDSAIGGEALLIGGNVDLRNRVSGDVKALGGNLEITGAIEGNLMIAGGRVDLERQATIDGNIWAAGGRIDIDSTIGRDLRVGGRRVTIGGEIKGDVHVDAVEFEILPTARFGGNLTYRSPSRIDLPDDVVVAGDVTFVQSRAPERAVGAALAGAGGFVLLVLAELFVLGIVIVLLLPRWSVAASELARTAPWPALGVGLAIIIGTPIVILLLLTTVVGITLGLALGAIYFIALLFGLIIGSLLVSRQALRWLGRNWDDGAWGRIGLVVVGILIIAILAIIPFLGALVVLAAVGLGIGSLTLQLFRTRRTALAP